MPGGVRSMKGEKQILEIDMSDLSGINSINIQIA